jgi:hypothetical protein
VAEAVFTGEKIEELPNEDGAATLAFALAPVARFAKEFFMGDGPGGACDGNGEKEEVGELAVDWHEHNEVTRCTDREMRLQV